MNQVIFAMVVATITSISVRFLASHHYNKKMDSQMRRAIRQKRMASGTVLNNLFNVFGMINRAESCAYEHSKHPFIPLLVPRKEGSNVLVGVFKGVDITLYTRTLDLTISWVGDPNAKHTVNLQKEITSADYVKIMGVLMTKANPAPNSPPPPAPKYAHVTRPA